VLCVLAATGALAQDQAKAAPTPEDPLVTHKKWLYANVQQILLQTAEKMPEEHYSFRPAEDVRTFGQLVGHVADGQYIFCSSVREEKNPGLNVEKTKASKAELLAALKEAFAYCDRAYAGLTDDSAGDMVKSLGGRMHPKLGLMTINSMHNMLHYGNMVTYMRMKDVVPPTSDPGFRPVPQN
jgi:uncharacterized damage-inducible protein DinB